MKMEIKIMIKDVNFHFDQLNFEIIHFAKNVERSYLRNTIIST